MGWASGVEILEETWSVIREDIPEDKRVEVLSKIMKVFGDHDCDNYSELDYKDNIWPEINGAINLSYKMDEKYE